MREQRKTRPSSQSPSDQRDWLSPSAVRVRVRVRVRVHVRSLTWFLSVVVVEQAVGGDLNVLGQDVCHLAAGCPAASAVCGGGGGGCGGGGGGGGGSVDGPADPALHADASLLAGEGAALSSSSSSSAILHFTRPTLLFLTLSLTL